MIDWNYAYEIAGEIVEDLAKDGIIISASQQEGMAHIILYKARRIITTAPDPACCSCKVFRPDPGITAVVCINCGKPQGSEFNVM